MHEDETRFAVNLSLVGTSVNSSESALRSFNTSARHQRRLTRPGCHSMKSTVTVRTSGCTNTRRGALISTASVLEATAVVRPESEHRVPLWCLTLDETHAGNAPGRNVMSMSIVSPSPALKKGFASLELSEAPMTMQGAINKSIGLLAVLIVTALAANTFLPAGLLLVSALAGFGLAIATCLRPTLAPKTAVLYALCQGVTVGLVSKLYAQEYGGGIIVYALGVTLSIFAVLLAVYRARLITVTENFRLGVVAATGGIAIYYLIASIARLFGASMPLLASTSWMGIGFSVLVVVIASANLVIDFDFIEHGVEQGVGRHMEWYAAFGLLVTLVWLYLEVLRLIAKLQSRD